VTWNKVELSELVGKVSMRKGTEVTIKGYLNAPLAETGKDPMTLEIESIE